MAAHVRLRVFESTLRRNAKFTGARRLIHVECSNFWFSGLKSLPSSLYVRAAITRHKKFRRVGRAGFRGGQKLGRKKYLKQIQDLVELFGEIGNHRSRELRVVLGLLSLRCRGEAGHRTVLTQKKRWKNIITCPDDPDLGNIRMFKIQQKVFLNPTPILFLIIVRVHFAENVLKWWFDAKIVGASTPSCPWAINSYPTTLCFQKCERNESRASSPEVKTKGRSFCSRSVKAQP